MVATELDAAVDELVVWTGLCDNVAVVLDPDDYAVARDYVPPSAEYRADLRAKIRAAHTRAVAVLDVALAELNKAPV
jgi:hypothetical protein